MSAHLFPFPAARRVKPTRPVPLLGVTDQLDDGTWLATALDGREYGPFRFRPEACEVLLLVAPFPDAMTADRTREAT
jgi:hypothetical protein